MLHRRPSTPWQEASVNPQALLFLPCALGTGEPMVNAGGAGVYVLPDGWTVKTTDGSLSAHYEHTVALTADGPILLTKV